MTNQVLWQQLIDLIANRIGFRIRPQDIQYLSLKIESRIKALKLSSLEEYYNLLDRVPTNNSSLSQKEWKILANTITNGESFFFRDRGQFDLLQNTILPKIIANKRKAKERGETPYLSLKVWSAGCSTGEEVYSLAMLISELIPDPAQWQIVIIGTDINQTFLKLAREGIYKKWSFRLTDPLLKTKYFIANKENWQVKPHIKSMISFYRDNLIDVDTISHYNYAIDLVLCRNVFIYFDVNSIKKAVQKIASTLNHGGYLVSGHAELQAIKLNNFKLISFPESIVYQYAIGEKEKTSLVFEDFNLAKNIVKNAERASSTKLKSFNLSERNAFKSRASSQNYIQNISNINNLIPQNNSEDELKKIQDLLNQKDYYNTIKVAEQLIAEKHERKDLYYSIALANIELGNLKEAKIFCDRLLRIDAVYIPILFLLARIATKQNNYRQAKEILKKIIYLEPLSINAYLDLGKIYHQEKNLKRSKKMYQTAYDFLQKSTTERKIDYQGYTKAKDLLAFIKPKL